MKKKLYLNLNANLRILNGKPCNNEIALRVIYTCKLIKFSQM